MKTVTLIAAAAMAVFLEGVANAAPVDRRVNVTADPAAMCDPNAFCSTPSLIFRYDDSAIQGDVVVWGCHGCRGEVAEGLPPWMRKVPTATGYDLVGRPQPGLYRVKSYYDGVYKPSLDVIYRFVPR
ncbi:hypothetical protein AMK06_CH02016 [Rhizobium sp. N541]|uniref:hypothetical protein n=1 Tax=unclassified Rhizobium TaxID=2613769 RepID=UPI0007EE450D|nr:MULTISPECIES: hypothetical protein [unclassified Rhizobium]ANM16916.1 hypothetical protein AMK06_CH02016 [Rhizobium sp. N541]ANM23301.1 hypothetical protein AMK07_CH02013 [Rhizobium sp. N941]